MLCCPSGAGGAASDRGTACLAAGRIPSEPTVPVEEEVQWLPGAGPEPAGGRAGSSDWGHRSDGQQQPLAGTHWRQVCVCARVVLLVRHTPWIKLSHWIICKYGCHRFYLMHFSLWKHSHQTLLSGLDKSADENLSQELLCCHGCLWRSLPHNNAGSIACLYLCFASHRGTWDPSILLGTNCCTQLYAVLLRVQRLFPWGFRDKDEEISLVLIFVLWNNKFFFKNTRKKIVCVCFLA